MRKRKSKIWSTSKDDLAKIVSSASSFSEILRSLSLTTKGTSNFGSLKKRLVEDCIDYSHIRLGICSNKGRKFPNAPKASLENILVVGSSYNRGNLKKRLIKEGLLEYKCNKCGISDGWQGEFISLQLDHINGVPDDNRLCNLRLLCPNCHSQTRNFSGRANKKMISLKIIKIREPRSSKRPSKEDLQSLLWVEPTVKIAKKYGVSDNAVAKWCRCYGLSKPPRGYWARLQSSVVEALTCSDQVGEGSIPSSALKAVEQL